MPGHLPLARVAADARGCQLHVAGRTSLPSWTTGAARGRGCLIMLPSCMRTSGASTHTSATTGSSERWRRTAHRACRSATLTRSAGRRWGGRDAGWVMTMDQCCRQRAHGWGAHEAAGQPPKQFLLTAAMRRLPPFSGTTEPDLEHAGPFLQRCTGRLAAAQGGRPLHWRTPTCAAWPPAAALSAAA